MSQQTLRVELVMCGERDYLGSLLPVSIIDARGQVLNTGAVSSQEPTELVYERGELPVFVRMALPNGTMETRPLFRNDRTWLDQVTFLVGDNVTTYDWMAWSAARLDVKHQGGALLRQPGMEGAWFQLWEKSPSALHWRQVPMKSHKIRRSQKAIQFELGFSPHSRALVVRLDSDSPQVVSLPNKKTRVLVTTLSTPSGTVEPRVIVGGYSPNAEAIMEFLRAGRLGLVETILDPGSERAHLLLYNKLTDPIAATAAAYYLLRKRDWERLPPHWMDNLVHWNDKIPDAQLIRAASLIERGMPIRDAANLAVRTLSRFFDSGIPLFAEATWVLSDLLAIAEKAEVPLDARIAKSLRMILASSRPLGLSFGYAGTTPGRPMAADKAFELRQGTRNGVIGNLPLSKVVRQKGVLPNLRPVLGSSSSSLKTDRRQLSGSVGTRKRSDVPRSTSHYTTSGGEAKTLFLRDVLGEVEIDAQ